MAWNGFWESWLTFSKVTFFSVLNISISLLFIGHLYAAFAFFPDTSTHILSTEYSSSYSICKKTCWRLYHLTKNGEMRKLEWDIRLSLWLEVKMASMDMEKKSTNRGPKQLLKITSSGLPVSKKNVTLI